MAEAAKQRREISVAPDEDGLRLDRWFKERYPNLTHGRLQKLLRTGQVRVDGSRAKAGDRLTEGARVRVPPGVGEEEARLPAKPACRPATPDSLMEDIRARVLFKDDEVLVIDKPAGLAVQGGTGQRFHLDAMLDGLRFGAAEGPRLVHRLDKDTSGVLALARTRASARWLTRAFRDKRAQKLYWAAVAGLPEVPSGRISLALEKATGRGGRQSMAAAEGTAAMAVTYFRMIDRLGEIAAWLAMAPQTGRTHQLRVHAAMGLQTPILGDGKYGGRAAFPDGLEIPRRLHLHARRLTIPRPNGKALDIVAGLPENMRETWRRLGFDLPQETGGGADDHL